MTLLPRSLESQQPRIPEATALKDASTPTSGSVIRVYRRRWGMLGLYIAVICLNSVPYMQYTVVGNVLAKYFSVSKDDMEWMTMVSSATATLFIFPAAWVLDKYVSVAPGPSGRPRRKALNCLGLYRDVVVVRGRPSADLLTLCSMFQGLRVSVLVGAAGTAAGLWLKTLGCGTDGYWLSLAGQGLVSVATLFVVSSAPPRMAAVWFPPHQVASAVGAAYLVIMVSLCFRTAFTIREQCGIKERPCGLPNRPVVKAFKQIMTPLCPPSAELTTLCVAAGHCHRVRHGAAVRQRPADRRRELLRPPHRQHRPGRGRHRTARRGVLR